MGFWEITNCVQSQWETFYLRGAKIFAVKLVNNNSFAMVVQQGQKFCFMNLSSPMSHLCRPTCNLSNNQNTTKRFPEFDSAICLIMRIYLKSLIQSYSRDLGLTTKLPWKKAPSLSIYRPNRYYVVHKDIVDKFVNELLHQEFIQYNNIPYASPIAFLWSQ